MKLWQALLLFGLIALVFGGLIVQIVPDPPRGLLFGLGLGAALLAWKATRVKS